MNHRDHTPKHRIVVLGAGYAGAITAGRLAKRLHPGDVDITLVNADACFVERVRMHQLATGQNVKQRRLIDIFAGTGVTVRPARVLRVDADRKVVELADEREPAETGHGTTGTGYRTAEIVYDTLIYALGSTATDAGVPGVAEHACDIAGKRSALRLRERLGEIAPGGTVLVVGGGLTAIEAATEIAESHPDLRVAMAARGGVGDWLSDKAQRHLHSVLGRFGVTVHEHADITRVSADGAHIAARETGTDPAGTIPAVPAVTIPAVPAVTIPAVPAAIIPAELIVWAAGFTVHPVAAATTLRVSEDGRIVVDGTMRSVSHPDVYAVGDAAHAVGIGDRALRMGCATASPMAWQAADALVARLTGREVPEAPIGYSAQCISLGRRDAIFQKVTPEDRPTSSVLTGRFGAWVKELICSGAAWSVRNPTLGVPSRRRRIVVDGVARREPVVEHTATEAARNDLAAR
ncbi:NAD(P)/FAD-dependent oxidoreductase [Nocardia jejuensis]|uniref:NAD(P)/FAD-dependent oxidoreductase n=1 Tax=Nocardia jejuensis TaxID=328049 RepID=UPI00083677F1|nr:FAD-dependent oxidoreductase [Nocardia jejuensis]